MKIGFVGAGNIGGTAAKLFAGVGHEVAVANSRGPETLAALVAEIGPNAHAATVEKAVDFGDVVMVSIPIGRILELPPEPFAGKIVIDTNNYYPDRDGHIEALDRGETTSSELLAKHLPGARIVKAFNTIWFQHLAANGDTALPVASRHTIFVAGDDAAAKATVIGLIEEIGFAGFDTGALGAGGRLQQPGTALYNKRMTPAEASTALGQLH